jgi:hypothetical protein
MSAEALPLDFLLGEIFAHSVMGVGKTTPCDCSFYSLAVGCGSQVGASVGDRWNPRSLCAGPAIFRYDGHQSMFIVTAAGVIATDPISE